MRWVVRGLGVLLLLAVAAVFVLAFAPGLYWRAPALPAQLGNGDPARGERVFAIAGCTSCHTADEDGAPFLAGGRRLETPYGAFVVPNITPDRDTGIGGWTARDFVRAMTVGLSPGGRHYYPAFPYTSYTRMTLRDLVDLKAYLDTVPPVRNAAGSHELDFPYDLRPALGLWKLFFFDPGRFMPESGRPAEWNRGAYLVTGPGHCGECHTPRNFAGARRADARFAGTESGPDGDRVPGITPHEDGISGWSAAEIADFLEIGITPEGDFAGGAMAEVIEHSTGTLSPEDREAIAAYLLSLPARPFGGE